MSNEVNNAQHLHDTENQPIRTHNLESSTEYRDNPILPTIVIKKPRNDRRQLLTIHINS